MDQWQVGDKIIITNDKLKNEKGEILYIGLINGRPETYYGIGLEKEKGKHNGFHDGKQYFQCPDGHGVFIQGQYLEKYDESSAQIRKDQKKSMTMIAKPTKPKEVPPVVKKEDKVKKETKKAVDKPVVDKPVVDKPVVDKPVVDKPADKQADKPVDKPADKQAVPKQAKVKQQEEPEVKVKEEVIQQVEPTTTSENSLNTTESQEFQEQLQNEAVNHKQQLIALQTVNNDQKSQIAMLKKKVEQLEQQIDQTVDDMTEYEALYMQLETLKVEKEKLEFKNKEQEQTMSKQLEDIKRLEEEKSLMELEVEEAILTVSYGQSDGVGDHAALNSTNQRLALALQQVTSDLESLKLQRNNEIAQFQQKLDTLPMINEKAQKCGRLEQQVAKLQEEIQDLMQRVDESSSLSDIVEKMSGQLMKKDDEMDRLRNIIKESDEMKKLDQILIQELDDGIIGYKQILDQQADEINKLKQEIVKNQEIIDDKDGLILRLKQKITQLNKQIDINKEDDQILSESGIKTGSGTEELIRKNQDLIISNREMYKKYIHVSIDNIDVRNLIALKGILIFKSLPQEYCQKLKFNLLDPIITVRRIGEKAFLIAEEFINNVEQNYERFIKEENQDLAFWMLEAYKQLFKLYSLCNCYATFLQNQNVPEAIEKVGRNVILVNQFKIADVQIDLILNLIRKDKLSPQESLGNIQGIVSNIQDDLNQIISTYKFKENCEYQGVELIENLGLIVQNYNLNIFNYRLIKDQENLRQLGQGQVLVIDQLNESVIKKCREQLRQLRYGKLYWGTYQWSKQRNEQQFNQLYTLSGELLVQLQNIKIDNYELYLSSIVESKESESEQDYQLYRDNCVSMVHLLNNIHSQFEEQNITDEFTFNRQNQSTQHSYSIQCQWSQWQKELRSQLQDVSFTIENERRLKETLEQTITDKQLIQNDLVGLKKAREALEHRVVELQLKADRVQVLENEKKRLLDKIHGFNEATELTKKEFENIELKLKESEDIRRMYEDQIRSFQQSKNVSIQDSIQFNTRATGRRNLTTLQGTGQMPYSAQNLDLDILQPQLQQPSQYQQLSELQPQNKGIEQVLMKENQLLKQISLRQEILEITEHGPKMQTQQLIQQNLLRLNKLKFDQLKQMAVGSTQNLKGQATKIYLDCLSSLKLGPDDVRCIANKSSMPVRTSELYSSLQRILTN